ncbi:cobalamin biosynthesis protein [Acetobacter conturbans]|uniref:Precorrin methylase n=1 Tax=Acetobacter conturbans TaxID=1737472 RepID=A0ABX0JWW1_9PROT|nr:cobalamin biosynthesis protein [Acetobacter conturbans]NHN87036.1 precorrin methylase [Acetobacter conturbans]
MKVAGFGFRREATPTSLRDALAAAGGEQGLDALATITQKAASPALLALAGELGLPVHSLGRKQLEHIRTPTHSPRVMAAFGIGSLAEAAALSAAGPGARLLSPRAQSADGMATAAIAETVQEDGE